MISNESREIESRRTFAREYSREYEMNYLVGSPEEEKQIHPDEIDINDIDEDRKQKAKELLKKIDALEENIEAMKDAGYRFSQLQKPLEKLATLKGLYIDIIV